jgi:ribosomal protein S18 acetylase RimI-like enzyme
MIQGSCLCGSARYQVQEAAAPMANCHCQMCRKAHGSAFSTILPVKRAGFRWLSGEDLLAHFESSPGKRRWFCSRCGSQLISTRDGDEDSLLLRAGCIDSGYQGEPVAHGWVEFAAPWYEVGDDLPRFERGFPGSPAGAAPSVRRFAPHEWRRYRDLRLRALADSPDAFGSTLARERDRSDQEWAARLASDSGASENASDPDRPRALPLVAEFGAELVGLAWGLIDPSEPEVAHVYQMWVAPKGRRMGAARMLLDEIISWASRENARRVVLGVTCGNTPATRLYARAGFEPVGEPSPIRPDASVLGQEMQLTLG